MKKFFLLLIISLFTMSCSNKVEIKGKVRNGNPLERVEIIEASGVATLPLSNIGLNNKGEFNGEVNIPKNGMYLLTYGGNATMVYLKSGQTLEISGDQATFPATFEITGDAKANNDFLKAADKSFQNYASKLPMEAMIAKAEPEFIKEFTKIQDDVNKLLDADAKKLNADADVLSYKKLDVTAKFYGLLDAYEQSHGVATGNANYKPTAEFTKLKEKIGKDGDNMIRLIPVYRDYALGKLNGDFQTFAQTKMMNSKEQPLMAELFGDFLKQKKGLTDVAKDYFYAYVVAQSDINPNNIAKYDQITSLIDKNIKDANIKADMKSLQKALMGEKAGSVPSLKVKKADGSSTNLSDLKGKPTLVMFYASYNPNIATSTVTVLKEVNAFYKSKLNFAYVNLDDTEDQFKKTSSAMLKGIPGENLYVNGGINSKEAKDFGLYAFKLPGYILLDKDGKIVGKNYYNLGDPELIGNLDKLTGLTAPQVQMPAQMPQIPMQPEGEVK